MNEKLDQHTCKEGEGRGSVERWASKDGATTAWWLDEGGRISFCPYCGIELITEENRRLAIESFRKVLGPAYPARWVDGKTSKGDFPCRDVAVDVFNVPVNEQRKLLKSLREARDMVPTLLGSRCLFLFHTPEATEKHYKDILAELTK